VTARTPVSPGPLTVTEVSVPLVAVTVMPLAGSAPVLPEAGEMLIWTYVGDGEGLAGLPLDPLPDDDWQAAASRPAAQTADRRISLRRFDSWYSCSTPSSRVTRIFNEPPCPRTRVASPVCLRHRRAEPFMGAQSRCHLWQSG